MRAVKAVQLPYKPTEEILSLLETFRDMVNYCIHVGLEKRITPRFKLSNKVYHKLNECGLHSWYCLSAIEVATSILKNYRKAVPARIISASSFLNALKAPEPTFSRNRNGFGLSRLIHFFNVYTQTCYRYRPR